MDLNINPEREKEILSKPLDELLQYYVRVPTCYTNYFLTTNFKNDQTWVEQFLNYLNNASKLAESMKEYKQKEAYDFLIEVCTYYFFYRAIKYETEAEKFMFIIICIIDSARSSI